MTFPDLRFIERSGRPNDALACLPGDCAVPAEFEVPIIPVDVSVLMQSAEAVLRAEPRTALLERLEDPERLVFVQRSRLFRFPDTVCIQGVAHEDGASAIIYSRSNYGFWDIGKNRRRVRRWLARLQAEMAPASSGQVSPSA